MKFLIYSLPRSGSAWLSVFLSGKDSYCFHDALADDMELKQLITRPETIVGTAETAAFALAPGIHEKVWAKPFVLTRDPQEIGISIAKMGKWMDPFKMRSDLDALGIKDEIEYKWLGDVAYLEEVWARVIGTDFDRDRAKLLKEMHIERDYEAILARCK
jgi:hypothetical protein